MPPSGRAPDEPRLGRRPLLQQISLARVPCSIGALPPRPVAGGCDDGGRQDESGDKDRCLHGAFMETTRVVM